MNLTEEINRKRSLFKRMFFPYKVQHRRLKKISVLSSGKVLDVGYNQMPNPYLRNVIGLDMHVTQRPENYDDFISANLNNGLPLRDNSFDTITAGETIEHLENPAFFLRECKRVLKPKGKLIITTPNPYFPIGLIFNVFFSLTYHRYTTQKDHISIFPPLTLLELVEYSGLRFLNYYGHNEGLIKRVIGFYRGISKYIIFECEKD